MTANELADELMKCSIPRLFYLDELMNNAAIMLRQQQAEIEALKQIIDANNLNQNIGQFVKPTNEPVMWMYINKKTGITEIIKNKSRVDVPHLKEIPLYTHPVKELTDEEIEECCCFLDVRLHHRYEPNAVVKDIEWTVTGIKDFVEAILRKAQE